MAARVNTQFVLILSAVLVVLVAGAGLGYYFVLYKSPETYMNEGEAYFASGMDYARSVDNLTGSEADEAYARSGEEFGIAVHNFRKALEDRRTDVDLILRYIDALNHVHVETPLQARQVLFEVDQKLQLATEISNRDDLLERYYASTFAKTTWGGGASVTESFLGELSTRVNNKLDVDPENPIALKYRGVVRTMRLDQGSGLDDYHDAKDDLEKARRLLPEDPLVPMFLSRWYIKEADRVSADETKLEENIKQSLELTRETLKRFPDDTDTKLWFLKNLLAEPVFRPGKDRPEHIEQRNEEILTDVRRVVEELRTKLLADPRPMEAVLQLGDISMLLDRKLVAAEEGQRGQTTEGIKKAEELFRKAIQAEPLNVVYRVALGNLLKLQMNLDEALQVYRDADGITAQGTAEMVVREMGSKHIARYEIANIELINAENETDTTLREAKLKIAEDAIEALGQVSQSKARIYLLEGKVAMLRGQSTVAMQKLDQAAELYIQAGSPDIEAMLLSARARQQQQQWGAAAERLERVVSIPNIARSPESESRLRSQLAEVYLNSDQVEKARFQIDRLKEIGHEIAPIAMLSAALDLKDGRVEDAMAAYEAAGIADRPSVINNVTRGLRAAGRHDEARAMLEGYLLEHPDNLALINELNVYLSADPQERAEELKPFLDRAEAAGADPNRVRAMRIAVAGIDDEATRSEFVEVMAGSGDDVVVELRKSSLWDRMGNDAEARAAFRRAEALEPDHPQVILTGIKYAVKDNDTQKLNRLATKAADGNVDLANGDFVRGQIAAAQSIENPEKLGEAISFYTQGLEKRPIYDEGWKMLGDLYMRRNALDEAADAYQKAVDQKPDNVAALIGLSSANEKRGRPSAAVQAMRQAVRQVDTNPAVLQRYLEIETRLGNPAEALAVQRRIAERHPNVLQNRLGIALLLAQNNQYDEAAEEIVAIEEQFGATLQTTATRAQVLHEGGDSQAGRAAFESYLAQRGDEATLEDHIACARYLLQAGMNDAAYAAYERAIAIDTDDAKPATRELADRLFENAQYARAADLYQSVIDTAVTDDEDRGRLYRRQTETLLRADEIGRAEELLASQQDTPEVLMLRSLVSRQRGDDAAALGQLDQALRLDPNYAMAYVQRGTLKSQDDLDAALADAEAALAIDGTLASALRLKAQVQMRQGKTTEAIRGFNSVISANPNDFVARANLADLYLREGNLAAGRPLISEGRRLDPDNPIWSQLEARYAVASGNPDEIIAKLEEAVLDNPSPVNVQALSEAYLDNDQPRDALALLEENAGLVNANVALQARKGHALIASGQLDPGARMLTLALQRCRSLNQLMYVSRAGNAALGLDRISQLLDLVGDNSSNRRNTDLAKALLMVGEQEYDRALEILPSVADAAEGVDANAVVIARRAIGLCYYATQRFEQAEAAYRQLLEINPDDYEVLNNLAYMLVSERDKAEEGLELAEKAAELTQDYPQAGILDTLGLAQLRTGRFDEARKTLEGALEVKDIAPLHLHLAEVYQQLDLPTKARQSLQQAIRKAEAANDQDTLEKARRLSASL